MADVSPQLVAALSGTNPQAYAQFLVQQQQLARNQAMAQALMKQTLSPDMGTQEVSGRVVPYTMGQGFTKLAQAYLTSKMNEKNDQQASDLGMAQGLMYANAMKVAQVKLSGGTPADGGAQTGATTDGTTPVQVTNSATQGASNPVADYGKKNMSIATDPMVLAMFPELAKSASSAAITAAAPTDAVKTAVAQRRDLPTMGRLATAADVKGGTLSLDQGKVAMVPDSKGGYSQGFVPEIPTGSNLPANWSPFVNNGQINPQSPLTRVGGAPEITNSNAAAESSGAAAGKAPYEKIEVTDPVSKKKYWAYAGNAMTMPGFRNEGTGSVPPTQQGAIQANAVNSGITTAPVTINAPGQPGAAPDGGAWSGLAPGESERAAQGQTAPIENMKSTQAELNAVRQAAPAMTTELDRMIKLAPSANWATIGSKGTGFAKLFSSDAAEYEKGRDYVVSQLASGGMNTDAARSMVYGAIPPYEAPKEAKIAGLENLRNMVATKALKSSFLTGPFNSGDVTAHTSLSDQFDRNIVPSMAPVLTMPPGPQRGNALRMAIQSNPMLKPRFDWAVQNGILK